MRRTLSIIATLLLLLAAAVAVFAYRVSIRELVETARRPDLPEAQPFMPPTTDMETVPSIPRTPVEPEDTTPAPSTPIEPEVSVPSSQTPVEDTTAPAPMPQEVIPPTDTISSGVNLGVPFSSQAPNADWSLPYQEACEETSLMMVDAWIRGMAPGTIDPTVAERTILDIVSWEKNRFGYYEDTTAEETAIIAREYFGYTHTEVLPVRSIEDIKKTLLQGYAVIVPASGKELNNPYFSGDGPLFHMLVIKGFTEDGHIITNDPGTRRGADFLYNPDVLFNAIGDWNDGNPSVGEKLMIIVKK